MDNYFDDPALPKVRIQILEKRKHRVILKRNKVELSNYLIINNVKSIVESDGEYQFLDVANELYGPKQYFDKIHSQLLKQIRENKETYNDFRREYGDPFVPFPRSSIIVKSRPINKELHSRLLLQINDLNDFYQTWLWFEKRLKFKVDEIPMELQPPQMKQHKTQLISKKISLSKKDNDDLNATIYNTVEKYLDQNHSLQKAFELSSINSAKHFKKWLKLSEMEMFSAKTIEGRYKRYKKNS